MPARGERGGPASGKAAAAGRGAPVIPFSVVRRSSMILAETGERVPSGDARGTWKVRTRGSTPDAGERVPLLGENGGAAEQHANLSYTDEPEPPRARAPASSPRARAWPSVSHQTLVNVAKCTLAYTVASLFVFTPLGDIFGFEGSKHQIATVSVYFNPARTAGSMVQAGVFVSAMLAYAFIDAELALGFAHVMQSNELFDFGDLVLLVVFCGAAFALIGYVKIRMDNRAFDSACTVAIIFLVIAIIKDDDIQHGTMSGGQLTRYLVMVLSGAGLSALVCLLLFPQTAVCVLRDDLRQLMNLYTAELGDTLNDFVRGRSTLSTKFTERQARMAALQRKAQKDLADAQIELTLAGRPQKLELLAEIVESCSRVARHLGGLSHCTLVLDQLLSHPARSLLAVTNDGGMPTPTAGRRASEAAALRVSAGVLFQTFIYYLGPPMNSFTTTLNDIIGNLPLDTAGQQKLNHHFLPSLHSATKLYSSARERALDKVYGCDSMSSGSPKLGASTRAPSPASQASRGPSPAARAPSPIPKPRFERGPITDEGVVATCGNFSYLLEDLGEEIEVLLRLLAQLEELERAREPRRWPLDAFLAPLRRRQAPRPFSQVRSAFSARPAEAQTLGYRVWWLLRFLRKREVQFAIKLGAGAVVLAAPAFFKSTRPMFRHWRGEWAVIIYLLIMSVTLGAMTANIPYRLGGTALGAGLATLGYVVSGGNPWVLLPFGTVVAAGCFYSILTSTSPFGRFTLLTYNLVALYGYSATAEAPPPEQLALIIYIGWHRAVAVTVGVLWAVFVTVVVFPHTARRALRRDLSAQWLRLGMVWKANPLGTLPRKDPTHRDVVIHGIYGDKELQDAMPQLQVLITNSTHEFRLRGTFDARPFETMLRHTQVILDAYHGLAILIAKSPTATSKELELIEATRDEVRELGSTLFLYFYTASTSLRVGLPVPDNLPVPVNAVERLLRKLKEHRVRLLADHEGFNTEDLVLFYSYVLATLTVVEQIASINDVLRTLYGAFYDDLFLS